MKKLITGILAILACSCVLTGCNFLPGNSSDNSANESVNSSSSVDTSAIEEARDFLDALYKEKNVETREDYTVLKQLTYDEVVYDLAWSVNVSAGVTIVVQENDVKIDVDENLAQDLDYILTATLSDAEGNTASVSFNRTVLQAPQKVPCPISTTPEEGVAYKFYVYQPNARYEDERGERYINGQMENTYYFATVGTYADGIDVYAEYTQTEGQFYIYHNVKALDENGAETTAKKYINVVQSGTHINAKYEDAASSVWVFDAEYGTIVTTIDNTKYYLGCDGDFVTVEPQKVVGAGYYMGYLVSEVDKNEVSDSSKVKQEKSMMTFAAAYVGDCTATLQEYGSTYPEVRISWSTEDANATVNGNVVTFTDPTATKTITLKATLTCGEKTETATFNVTLVKNDTESILAAAYNLNEGESFANKVTLEGIISAIPTAYDEEYANITITMIVNEDLEQPINCYRLVGTGADVLGLGYTVTVKGIITNYNGTVQFTKGCEMTSYVEGSAEDVPVKPALPTSTIEEALAASTGSTVQVSGKVIFIKTAWSDQYKNMGVFLQDATGIIFLYKITTQVALGDTLTVAGTIDNYNGLQQIKDSTVTVTANDASYEITYAEKTVADIANTSVGTPVKLTGTISNIDGNYTTLTDATGSITLFKISGVELNDSVVITGVVDIYNTKQIAAGVVVSRTPGESGGETPVEYETITIEKALEIGSQYEQDKYTTDSYYITGTIVEIANTTYGNLYLADENGTLLYVYGLYDEENNSYDAMTTKPLVGDTVKVLSVVGNHNGAQLKNAVVVEHTKNTTVGDIYKAVIESFSLTAVDTISEAGDITLATAGTTYTDVAITWESDSTYAVVNGGIITWTLPSEETTVTLTATLTCGESSVSKTFTVTIVVEDPIEVGTAYKFYIDQKTNGKVYYFNGKISGNFLSTVENPVAGVDVYAEKTTGGYNLYFMDGETKTYIGLNDSNKIVLETTASTAFSFNATLNFWYSGDYYLGTYKTYSTISASKTSFVTGDKAGDVDKTQFPARFVKSTEVNTDENYANYALSLLKVDTANVTADKEITLPTETINGATTTWTLTENACATLSENLLSIKMPAESTTVTVTASVKYGAVTVTKDFKIEVVVSTGEASITTVIDFTAQNYTNAQEVTSVSNDIVTITFDKGTNSNPPKYYTSGTAIRVYGGNTVTISAEGKTISKIEITYGGSDGTNGIIANVGTFSGNVWEAGDVATNAVVLTIDGTKGNRRFVSITVTYC